MKKQVYIRLIRLFFKDKKLSISMLFLLAVSGIFTAIGPQVLGNITDVIMDGVAAGGVNWTLFGQGAMTLFGIYLIQFISRWIADWISVRLSSGVAYELRIQIEQKLWRLPLNYYDTVQRGNIMSVVTNDVDNVVTTLNQTGGDMMYYLLMLLGMIIMMFRLSWQLALVTVLLVPVSAWLVKKIGKLAKPQYKKQWAYTGQINAAVEESVNGHSIVKAFGREEEFIQSFHEKNAAMYSAAFRAMIISNMIQPLSRFLTNINYVIVALAGALKIINGSMSVGDVLAFIQYARQFQQPFNKLSQMFTTLQSGFASLERVYNLLEMEEEIADEHLLYEDYSFKGKIEFKDVSFCYVPEKKLIEHMNLTVEPGQMVAIVGATGAGKTTLVNLIERFYEINSGEIVLDDKVAINRISRETLRKNIGMVLQDTWLYQGTIRDNICYSLPNNGVGMEQEFNEACKAAFVDDFVRSLQDGYDTIISNEMSSLSAGEKQLLTIARTFLCKPNMLILDEATSSVDTRTEALIQEALNRLREGHTSFVIAHRLSTIRNADIILVMESGQIVEQGNHEELLRKNGVYAKLYQAQFSG